MERLDRIFAAGLQLHYVDLSTSDWVQVVGISLLLLVFLLGEDRLGKYLARPRVVVRARLRRDAEGGESFEFFVKNQTERSMMVAVRTRTQTLGAVPSRNELNATLRGGQDKRTTSGRFVHVGPWDLEVFDANPPDLRPQLAKEDDPRFVIVNVVFLGRARWAAFRIDRGDTMRIRWWSAPYHWWRLREVSGFWEPGFARRAGWR